MKIIYCIAITLLSTYLTIKIDKKKPKILTDEEVEVIDNEFKSLFDECEVIKTTPKHCSVANGLNKSLQSLKKKLSRIVKYPNSEDKLKQFNLHCINLDYDTLQKTCNLLVHGDLNYIKGLLIFIVEELLNKKQNY